VLGSAGALAAIGCFPWLPVLLIPQLLLTLGAAWLIASLGVFLLPAVSKGLRPGVGCN